MGLPSLFRSADKKEWKAEDFFLSERSFDKMNRMMPELRITKFEVTQVHATFYELDVASCGRVSVTDFARHFWLDLSEFTRRVFQLTDADDSGEIDFFEFLMIVYMFASLGYEGLVRCAFRIVDEDDSGFLDREEMEDLVSWIYGHKIDAKVVHIVKNMDFNKNGKISFAEFAAVNRQHPTLLHPAYLAQVAIRDGTMWPLYWKRRMKVKLNLDRIHQLDRAFRKSDRLHAKLDAQQAARAVVEALISQKSTQREVDLSKEREGFRQGRARNDSSSELNGGLCEDEQESEYIFDKPRAVTYQPVRPIVLKHHKKQNKMLPSDNGSQAGQAKEAAKQRGRDHRPPSPRFDVAPLKKRIGDKVAIAHSKATNHIRLKAVAKAFIFTARSPKKTTTALTTLS